MGMHKKKKKKLTVLLSNFDNLDSCVTYMERAVHLTLINQTAQQRQLDCGIK